MSSPCSSPVLSVPELQKPSRVNSISLVNPAGPQNEKYLAVPFVSGMAFAAVVPGAFQDDEIELGRETEEHEDEIVWDYDVEAKAGLEYKPWLVPGAFTEASDVSDGEEGEAVGKSAGDDEAQESKDTQLSKKKIPADIKVEGWLQVQSELEEGQSPTNPPQLVVSAEGEKCDKSSTYKPKADFMETARDLEEGKVLTTAINKES